MNNVLTNFFNFAACVLITFGYGVVTFSLEGQKSIVNYLGPAHDYILQIFIIMPFFVLLYSIFRKRFLTYGVGIVIFYILIVLLRLAATQIKPSHFSSYQNLLKSHSLIDYCLNQEIIPPLEHSLASTCTTDHISNYSSMNLIVLDQVQADKHSLAYIVRIFGLRRDLLNLGSSEDLDLVLQETVPIHSGELPAVFWGLKDIDPNNESTIRIYRYENGNPVFVGIPFRDQNGYKIFWKP